MSSSPKRGIALVKQYEVYCVLQVTRGVGRPQELLKWLRGQDGSQCFVMVPTSVKIPPPPCAIIIQDDDNASIAYS
jgi:hypothetical protein